MSENKLDLILEEIQSMKSQFVGLGEKVDRLDEKVNRLDEKSDIISAQVAKNSEDINVIMGNQKNIEMIVGRIATIQERQDKTIDLLARRSLDQEAELRRIK